MVSALFRWPCSISIHHLSPRSVTCGVRPFPLAMQHFYPFISQVSYCWCPPFSAGFSAGHVAFLFICLPHLSLQVSALFRWRCNISIRLFPRSVTGGVRPFPLAMQHVYSSPRSITAGVRPCPLAMQHFYLCVSPPFAAGISILSSPRSVTGVSLSIGHEIFLFICLPGPLLLVSPLFRWPCSILFICLPGLSLLVSALFRWRCNISIHLFSRSVSAGVRPFPLAMQHFYSFVSRVCDWCCRPFLLAMSHFYSFVSHVISFFLLHWCFCPVRWNRFTCERCLLL